MKILLLVLNFTSCIMLCLNLLLTRLSTGFCMLSDYYILHFYFCSPLLYLFLLVCLFLAIPAALLLCELARLVWVSVIEVWRYKIVNLHEQSYREIIILAAIIHILIYQCDCSFDIRHMLLIIYIIINYISFDNCIYLFLNNTYYSWTASCLLNLVYPYPECHVVQAISPLSILRNDYQV